MQPSRHVEHFRSCFVFTLTVLPSSPKIYRAGTIQPMRTDVPLPQAAVRIVVVPRHPLGTTEIQEPWIQRAI